MLGCPEADSPFLCQAMKRVAILGRRSSFHEEAALAFYQDIPLELKGFDSFKKMLAAYDSDEVDAVVIAVENTLSGGLVQNLELIHAGGYQVVGEVHIPIHHFLMALPGESLESIREVRSHEMALYQTRAFFEKNCPGVTYTKTSSTVAAVQEIVDGQLKGVAAVASRLAAKEFGMEVLAREIESSKENRTRFFVLDRYFRPEKAGDEPDPHPVAAYPGLSVGVFLLCRYPVRRFRPLPAGFVGGPASPGRPGYHGYLQREFLSSRYFPSYE